jgi:hypothetical protein
MTQLCIKRQYLCVKFFHFLEKLRFVVFLRSRRDAVTIAHPVRVTAAAALADDGRTVVLPAAELFILA